MDPRTEASAQAQSLNTESPEFDFDLPDDQIMAMNSAPPGWGQAAVTEESPAATTTVATVETDLSDDEHEKTAAPTTTVETPAEVADDGSTSPPATAGEVKGGEEEVTEGKAPSKENAETPNTPDPKNAPATAQKEGEAAKTQEPDYKSFYDRILGQPIKANGKDIQLQSPDEAVKLVQMGLNYTKKMQTLQPALRVVKMLENNQLLDEGKLAFLIDLDKGNPQAIQKLIADKGFNTLEVDPEKATTYVPGNHQVSNTEMEFSTVLDEVASSPAGAELITEVTKQWDNDSKQALFDNPQFLHTIHEQKANGLYGVINGEMDRLRALGEIPPTVPYLQAYLAVGNMLKDQNRLAVPGTEPPPVVVPEVPVATRVVTPPSQVKNTAQAQAAAAVKVTPSSPKPTINHLAMSDSDFLKEFDSARL